MTSKDTIVVKIGGSTLGSADTSFRDIVALQKAGRTPVVVHGGGPVISDWMKRQSLPPRFIRGLRVTDAPSLEVVVAVLAGLINKQLVAAISALDGKVVGLSGADGGMLRARISNPELGFVGEVTEVDPQPVMDVLKAGYIPLIAPVAVAETDGTGEDGSLLNINGDTAAGHLAWALPAQRLIFLTDVEGVMDSSRRLITRLTPKEVQVLLTSGAADGGMIPKLEACVKALQRVQAAQIIDGRYPHALLKAVNNDNVGTRLTA